MGNQPITFTKPLRKPIFENIPNDLVNCIFLTLSKFRFSRKGLTLLKSGYLHYSEMPFTSTWHHQRTRTNLQCDSLSLWKNVLARRRAMITCRPPEQFESCWHCLHFETHLVWNVLAWKLLDFSPFCNSSRLKSSQYKQ